MHARTHTPEQSDIEVFEATLCDQHSKLQVQDVEENGHDHIQA